MSRFDRRLKGADINGDGARPGTAVCSLPESSGQNVGMLGGNYLQQRAVYTPQKKVPPKRINGLAILQKHEDKITTLENRLMEIESSHTKNVSLQEVKSGKIEHNLKLLHDSYRNEMTNLKKYINVLEQKMKDLIKIDENSGNVSLNNPQKTNNIQLIIEE